MDLFLWTTSSLKHDIPFAGFEPHCDMCGFLKREIAGKSQFHGIKNWKSIFQLTSIIFFIFLCFVYLHIPKGKQSSRSDQFSLLFFFCGFFLVVAKVGQIFSFLAGQVEVFNPRPAFGPPTWRGDRWAGLIIYFKIFKIFLNDFSLSF